MQALQRHWREYAIEAALLGLFMVSACAFGTLLEHPGSPWRQALPQAWLRRLAMGCAMGLTAIAIIYSPWGQRSGAHINPATTLVFWRLGRVRSADAVFYALAQFAGATLGVLLMSAGLGGRLADPHVRWVVTTPGTAGAGVAFATEVAMTFVLMSVVLRLLSSRHAHWTGACVGALVAAYIAILAPLSGMSLNPARTFGSSIVAQLWDGGWIYWTAPPLGMLLAAELDTRQRHGSASGCAKLHHIARHGCIFCMPNDGA